MSNLKIKWKTPNLKITEQDEDFEGKDLEAEIIKCIKVLISSEEDDPTDPWGNKKDQQSDDSDWN